MKIIDRYVLATFVKNYLISFMVLIGLYISLDMVFNFANLTQTHGNTGPASVFSIIWDIVDFYFFRSFVFFVHLSGVIAVVAAAFTLMRLSRFNELTALLAAGTPLLRIALSVIVAGVVLNLVLLPLDQEVLIPHMIPKLIRDHQDVHTATIRSFPVTLMQDEQGNLLNAGLYTPGTNSQPARIDKFDIIQRNEELVVIGHLLAESAVWNGSLEQWDLTDGWHVPIRDVERPRAEKETPVIAYASDITPEKITLNLGKSYIQLLPTSKINQMLQSRKLYGQLDLLRTRHLRFTQPLANVILLLLAIPTVLTREPGRLKSAALRCMILTALCMGSIFLTYQLAGTLPHAEWIHLWPALMIWLPIFMFGPLAVWLLDRVKT